MATIEPPATPWAFPDPAHAGDDDVVAVGADLAPGTVLAAYRHGLFPMHLERQLAWWSPDPRGILPLGDLRVSRSLRKSCARFEIRVDTDFAAVIAACGDPRRDGGLWINDDIVAAYTTLHELGWAHSIEAWNRDGELAGGLYGVAIGGFFAGESMFHRETDASKVALAGLVRLLRDGGASLLDVQWVTPHLASLGAIGVPRVRYLALLREALARPLPAAFGG